MYSDYYYELLYTYAPLLRHNEKRRKEAQKNGQKGLKKLHKQPRVDKRTDGIHRGTKGSSQ